MKSLTKSVSADENTIYISVHRWSKYDKVPCLRAHAGFEPASSNCESDALATTPILVPAIRCKNILQEAKRHLNTTLPSHYPFSSQNGAVRWWCWKTCWWIYLKMVTLWQEMVMSDSWCHLLWMRPNSKQENSVRSVVKLFIPRGSLTD